MRDIYETYNSKYCYPGTTVLKNKLNKNYQIIWATGPKQYDRIKENADEVFSCHTAPIKVSSFPYLTGACA